MRYVNHDCQYCFLMLMSIKLKQNNRKSRGIDLEDGKSVMYVSVDGTDVRLQEPTPFNRLWYSHKFRAADLRYEMGVSLVSGETVWLYGPFPDGLHNDQSILNRNLVGRLDENEKVLGDRGYRSPRIVHSLGASNEKERREKLLRAYHEQINGKIKSFSSISQRWRHELHKHSTCMFAVVNIVQLQLLLEK